MPPHAAPFLRPPVYYSVSIKNSTNPSDQWYSAEQLELGGGLLDDTRQQCMKEKNTFPSKRKSIFYLILCLIATLFVSSFIYFLVLHPSLDNKIVRISINIGWTCFCLYAFKKLTQRHTLWWRAVDENPNKPKMN